MARKKTSTPDTTTDAPAKKAPTIPAHFESWSAQWRAICASAPPLPFDPTRSPRKAKEAAYQLGLDWLPAHPTMDPPPLMLSWLLGARYAEQIARAICSATITDEAHPLYPMTKRAREVVDLVGSLTTASEGEEGPHRKLWGAVAVRARASSYALICDLRALKMRAHDAKPNKAERVSALWAELCAVAKAEGVTHSVAAERVAVRANLVASSFDVTAFVRGKRPSEAAAKGLTNYANKLAREKFKSGDDDAPLSKAELHRWKRGGCAGVRPGKCSTKGCKTQVYAPGAKWCMTCIAHGLATPS